MPGWTEYVAPVRDKTIMWHKIWAESGKPRNGVIADIMRKTRASYHYAIRRIRRDADPLLVSVLLLRLLFSIIHCYVFIFIFIILVCYLVCCICPAVIMFCVCAS